MSEIPIQPLNGTILLIISGKPISTELLDRMLSTCGPLNVIGNLLNHGIILRPDEFDTLKSRFGFIESVRCMPRLNVREAYSRCAQFTPELLEYLPTRCLFEDFLENRIRDILSANEIEVYPLKISQIPEEYGEYVDNSVNILNHIAEVGTPVYPDMVKRAGVMVTTTLTGFLAPHIWSSYRTVTARGPEDIDPVTRMVLENPLKASLIGTGVGLGIGGLTKFLLHKGKKLFKKGNESFWIFADVDKTYKHEKGAELLLAFEGKAGRFLENMKGV